MCIPSHTSVLVLCASLLCSALAGCDAAYPAALDADAGPPRPAEDAAVDATQPTADDAAADATRPADDADVDASTCTVELESRVRFEAAHVPHGGTCLSEVQTRACTSGVWGAWSGEHESETCVVDPPRDCDEGLGHGQSESRVRYAARTVPFGGTCLSEVQTRACNDGALSAWSGAFAEAECAPALPASCGTIPHGGQESRVRYASAHSAPGAACEAEVQTRSCHDGEFGAWTGTFAALDCESVGAECDGVASGARETRVRYAASQVTLPETCRAEVQERSCADGAWSPWSGSFAAGSCQALAEPGCDGTPSGSVASRVRYRAALEPFGGACQAETQTRTCSAGTWGPWTGSFAESDCAVRAAAECEGTPHGGAESRVRYARAKVPAGETCEYELQTRFCEDGTFSAWDGSFAETACRVLDDAPTCTAGYDVCGLCGGTGTTRFYVDQDGDGYGDPALVRDLCPNDDRTGLVRDGSDAHPDCFTQRGDVVLEAGADVTALAGVCELDGHLTLRGDQSLETVELPALRYLDGMLRIAPCTSLACPDNAALTSVRLPVLETLESVLVGGNPKLNELALPALVSVSGNLQLGYCESGPCFGSPNLYRVTFSALRAVEGELGLALVPQGIHLGFERLTSVGAMALAYGSPRVLGQANFPVLRTIARRLNIANSNLQRLELPALEQLDSLFITGGTELGRVHLPALRAIRDLYLSTAVLALFDCEASFPLLRDFRLDGLLVVSDDLVALSCDSLAAVDSLTIAGERLVQVRMRGLREAGAIDAYAMAALTTLDMPLLITVARTLVVEDTALAGLAFPSLRDVGGNLELSNLEPGPLSFPALVRVGAAFLVDAVPTSLIDAPRLESVGWLRFGWMFRPAVIDLSSLRTTGRFELASVEVTELRLPALEHAGAFVLTNNDSLQVLSMPRLQSVAETFSLARQRALHSIHVPALSKVGALALQGNTVLPACVASELESRLGVSCYCSGNTGAGGCTSP